MRVQAVLLSYLLVGLFWVYEAHSADTTISYKGMPAPSAISPSISSFGSKMCRIGVSGAYSGGIFSASGGTTIVDPTCEKILLAESLEKMGLKVAAVSVLCQDERVFEAMLQAGSACPINGAIGDAAFRAWYELKPEVFKKLYGKDYTLPTYTNPINLQE